MKISTIRVTAFDMYDSCPYCYYLAASGVQQVGNKNMNLGSDVHRSIEQFHKGALGSSKEAKPFLDAYSQVYKAAPTDIVEYAFKLPIPKTNIILTGTIDLIKDEWIFEHKTSSGNYTQEQVDNHQQATAYSWAYRRIFRKPEKGIRFNVLVKNKTPRLQTLDTFRTDEDYARWFEHVYTVLDNIDNNKFDPAPGRFHNYKSCPMVTL